MLLFSKPLDSINKNANFTLKIIIKQTPQQKCDNSQLNHLGWGLQQYLIFGSDIDIKMDALEVYN